MSAEDVEGFTERRAELEVKNFRSYGCQSAGRRKTGRLTSVGAKRINRANDFVLQPGRNRLSPGNFCRWRRKKLPPVQAGAADPRSHSESVKFKQPNVLAHILLRPAVLVHPSPLILTKSSRLPENADFTPATPRGRARMKESGRWLLDGALVASVFRTRDGDAHD
jgi:hypothetical protein